MKPTPFELAKIIFETEPPPCPIEEFLVECLEKPSIYVFNTPKFLIAIEPTRPVGLRISTCYYYVLLAAGDFREAARFCLTNLPWLPHVGWERYGKLRIHRTSHVLKRFSIPNPHEIVQAESAPASATSNSGV